MLLFRKRGSKWLKGSVGLVIAGFGVLIWTSHELSALRELLSEAHPVHVMTGLGNLSEYIYLPEVAYPPALTDGDSDRQWTSTFATADDVMAWKPMKVRTPWELVAMARSDDERHRHIGLKLLASLQNLHPSLCRQIAQASDRRMALSLALSSSADLNMLLPPPKLPSDMAKTDVMVDLKNLLAVLPSNATHRCLQYFTSVALKEIYFNSEECFVSETSVPVRRSPPSQETTRFLYLRALLEHSIIPANRRNIVDSRGLQVLMKLCQCLKHSEERGFVAQIIGNLALDETCREKIFQSGWVTMLAEWSRSAQLEVSLSASRALANLSSSSNIALENGLYLAHPLHWDTESKILGDVIFVHGLLGGAFKTWRQDCRGRIGDAATNCDSSTLCWPQDWLAHDCPHVRVLLMDYETRLTEWSRSCPYDSDTRTLKARSVDLLGKLLSAGVGRRPIIWVAHSMGGLLVKNVLLHCHDSDDPRVRQLCENTKGIVFYSVPHRGSSLASFHLGSHHVFLPSPEVAQLRQGSEQLVRLHDRFSTWIAQSRVQCLSFGEQRKTTLGHLGMAAMFVSTESAEPGFGEYHLVDTDHVHVCKPSDRSAFVYQRFADFVHGLVDHSLLDELQHPVSMESEDRLRFVLSASFT